MKKILKHRLTLFGILFLMMQIAFTQTLKKDSLKAVTTVGIFDGIKINVGNFEKEEIYMINDYYISVSDISDRQADSLKGKEVLITGKLKIVEGKRGPAKTSADGKIYEPYVEPVKRYICKPTFSIIYKNREPLNK